MKPLCSRTCLVLLILVLPLLGVACSGQAATPDAETQATADSPQPTPTAATEAPAESSQPPRTAAAPVRQTAAPAPKRPEPRFVRVDVPTGTELKVEMVDALSSGTTQVGDPVRARLVGDLFADGELVARAGAELTGTVTEVVPLKKFGGQPKISLVFDGLEVESGESVPVLASHTAEGKKQAGRDAAKIGGGAVAGAVLGHQIDGDKGKEIGALIGGAIGTAVAAKTGEEIELAAGATITVVLENDVEVRIAR